MDRPLTKILTIYFFASILISTLIGINYGDRLVYLAKATEYINLIFALMAASVFSVASIVGDPSKLRGNWHLSEQTAKQALIDIKLLFYFFWLCIFTIAFSIFAEIERCTPKDYSCKHPFGIYRAFFGLSTFGLMMSLTIPVLMFKIHEESLNSEIESRKLGK